MLLISTNFSASIHALDAYSSILKLIFILATVLTVTRGQVFVVLFFTRMQMKFQSMQSFSIIFSVFSSYFSFLQYVDTLCLHTPVRFLSLSCFGSNIGFTSEIFTTLQFRRVHTICTSLQKILVAGCMSNCYSEDLCLKYIIVRYFH